jgi:hypothetical protein
VTPGIYRYRLSNGELSRAPRARGLWWIVGLAPLDADGAYVIGAQPPADGCGDISGEPPGLERPCQLVRSEPLSFRPVEHCDERRGRAAGREKSSAVHWRPRDAAAASTI